MIVAAALIDGCGSGSNAPATHGSTTARQAGGAKPASASPVILTAEPAGTLPAPVQLPATAVLGDRLLLMGGLDQATASLADILIADRGASRQVGTLP